jgi:hypothetical protein
MLRIARDHGAHATDGSHIIQTGPVTLVPRSALRAWARIAGEGDVGEGGDADANRPFVGIVGQQ